MSMIAVQAETAPYRLAAAGTAAPEPVAAEFAALSAAAREALTEMRRLLGVLRSDTGGDGRPDPDRAPQPRLGDIPELVGNACRAGAQVTLAMPGPPASPVPPGVGLAAYRIVQESLSNAARHAPGVAVRVQVGQVAGTVRVIVENEPGGESRRAESGSGHGLAGMRERAALLGGTLDAGRTDDGGFVVRAVLPAGKAGGAA
jgi:signal transduction histidine kinase